ncbi:hypothetical protein HanHA300_Chr05g0184021 [Helianthus annuus]|nr:hypothetical protein HanHA300_Chr05g0184021 [Helianthus annuus]KAJ0577870.1 hypothetical protein HanIR_Chr05g0240911 [Helianthus annuus]KAJ0747926.1 hypothetical protein HanOQP8_Chr05g0195221 [Helianthus annuus]
MKEMEMLSYPYVDALSQMVDQPISELKVIEPEGLNKNLCKQVFAFASAKRALFETSDEEGVGARPSSKKLGISEEPEQVTSMSIPIDVSPLSFARVEGTPLAAKDEGLDSLDGLYDDLPGSSSVPQGEAVVDEGVGGSTSALYKEGIVVVMPLKGLFFCMNLVNFIMGWEPPFQVFSFLYAYACVFFLCLCAVKYFCYFGIWELYFTSFAHHVFFLYLCY